MWYKRRRWRSTGTLPRGRGGCGTRDGGYGTLPHDVANAFNHMRVNGGFAHYLAFSHGGEYFAYAAVPFDARHSPRVFYEGIGVRLSVYPRALRSASDCVHGRCPVLALGQGIPGAGNRTGSTRTGDVKDGGVGGEMGGGREFGGGAHQGEDKPRGRRNGVGS
jgi:hypothetical protein